MLSNPLPGLISDHPSEVLFWTGAGISIDPPSCLPSGYQLTKDVVDSFCIPGTWEKIIFYLGRAKYSHLDREIKTIPRLESVLGHIVSLLGSDFLLRLYTLNPNPNYYHFFFAEHLLQHGKHITMNIDLGIENALCLIGGSDPTRSLLHLHGDFREKPSDLGLTFENISKGLPKNLASQAQYLIDTSNTLVFIGYSGSDFFDVNPFFLAMIGNNDLSKKTIYWIDFNKDFCFHIKYSSSDKKILILDALSECGAKCFLWKGPPCSFLDRLVEHWNMPNPAERFETGATNPAPQFDKTIFNWQKYLITAKVYISMGLGGEAYDILSSHGNQLRASYKQYCSFRSDLSEISPEVAFDYLVNEALRERGMYVDAGVVTKGFKLVTDIDKMLSFERRASDARLAGNWLSSREIYSRAIRFGRSRVGCSSRFDSVFLETLRGYLQLCRDICSIGWPLGMYARGDIVSLTSMINDDTAIREILARSPYDMSHIARLYTWEKHHLPKSVNARLPSSFVAERDIMPVFGETDNLLGVVNTRRSKLKAQLIHGSGVNRAEIIELIELSQAIGDNPGVVKASMLLASVGAGDTHSAKIFLAALLRTQWLPPIKVLIIFRFIFELILRSKLHANNQMQKTGT